ncbi:MAG TPA: PDZ domain-containing protein [Patescibacteria group bacterium]|nr:PDZ domain-containing protein [Patescibacteria group bacterium]
MNIDPWWGIVLLIGQGMVAVLAEPMFWMILMLVGWQYWQLARSQERMFGIAGSSLIRQVLQAGLLGLAGGLLGSFLLTLTGVTLNQLGLQYIWPVALALMIINMRFLCFAYAGGIVALANVLFGWPLVDVPQILALVAVLHITESFLIAVSGACSNLPVVLRREDGRQVGAFTLQNFWPLPLVMLAAVLVPAESAPMGVNMPDWWPLLPAGEPAPGQTWQYVMIPVVAALGYTDMAIASHPRRRRLESARNLAVYSLVLLGAAFLATKYSWIAAVAALLSPLGHELLIRWDNRREMNGVPRFVPPPAGVMVLDTVPGTPARRGGIQTGDVLTSVAGMTIHNRRDLAVALAYAPMEFAVILEREGQQQRIAVAFTAAPEEPDNEDENPDGRMLGVITVPEGDETGYVELHGEHFGLPAWLWRIWKGFWKNYIR